VRKVVITGAAGQLGLALGEALAARSPVMLPRQSLDIGDEDAASAALTDLRPDVLVNAAAYNAVDAAEGDVANAFRTNALAPLFLARACARIGALLVHFSTDYVFRGDRAPYREEDPPDPQNVYGASKLAGEQLVRLSGAPHLVIRTCGLYGRGNPTHFVEKMLSLAASGRTIRVVSDQIVAPTSVADLASVVVRLLDRWSVERSAELLGLYHVTNGASCSWLEFARAIFAEAGVHADVEPVSSEEFGARALRPACSVLANDHLRRVGLDALRPWREALRDYLRSR